MVHVSPSSSHLFARVYDYRALLGFPYTQKIWRQSCCRKRQSNCWQLRPDSRHRRHRSLAIAGISFVLPIMLQLSNATLSHDEKEQIPTRKTSPATGMTRQEGGAIKSRMHLS